MATLSPFVYWAQNETNLFIKVDLKDTKEPNINLLRRKLEFRSTGVGAQGCQNYAFSLDFYSNINPEESTCKVHDSKVDFNIVKIKKEYWPRLISKPQKPVWLKIDFDRWLSEEDLNSEDEKVRDIREDYPDLYNRLLKEEIGYIKENIKKVYLVIYNLLMFVGFTYVASIMGVQYLKDGVDCFPEIYESVGTVIRYLHILQLSEIILTLIGWRAGGVFVQLIQIGGRLLIILTLIDPEPRLQVQPVVFCLYLVWSSIEIIRYPYYITQVCKTEYNFLTWMRYSVWMIAYPIGISSEAVVMYKSIPYLEDTGRFTVTLPNMLNFTFSLVTIIRMYLLLFIIPTAYLLLSNMYYARIKKLRKKHLKTH